MAIVSFYRHANTRLNTASSTFLISPCAHVLARILHQCHHIPSNRYLLSNQVVLDTTLLRLYNAWILQYPALQASKRAYRLYSGQCPASKSVLRGLELTFARFLFMHHQPSETGVILMSN